MSTTIRLVAHFALMAFLLNFVWESWHAVWLYRGFDEPGLFVITSFRSFVRMMTQVSLTDAGLLTAIVVSGMALWRDPRWLQHRDRGRLGYLVGIGILVALGIEIKALWLWHQWSYTTLMPTLGGVGLSPLVQLATTGLVAWYLVVPPPLPAADTTRSTFS